MLFVFLQSTNKLPPLRVMIVLPRSTIKLHGLLSTSAVLLLLLSN